MTISYGKWNVVESLELIGSDKCTGGQICKSLEVFLRGLHCDM